MIMKMRKSIFCFRLFSLAALFIMAAPVFVHSGEITVKHGKFDHFNISMPEQMLAGEDITIKIHAVDSLNNTILSFGEPKKSFSVSVVGSSVIKSATFDSTSLVNGTLTFILNDKTAERVSLTITESDNPVPILSREFAVLPNKLSSLAVKSPRIVQAGEKFEIKIIEKDAFGNLVTEPVFSKNLNITFKGSSEPKVDMPLMPEFRNGIGAVNFIAEKAGTVIIEIKDMATGTSGASEKITVVSGPLHSFKLLHPREVIAGEAFDFSIIPMDRFGNAVRNYPSTGSGVSITASGKQKPFPSTVPAYSFINGQVRVALRYDEAEAIKLGVAEIGSKQAGTSDTIMFIRPVTEKLEIITPDSVIAGQKFKVKIIAYNQLNHIIKNYNIVGTDVLLSTTGTGVLMPSRIPPSEFLDGIAIVDLQYNKSESFEISAYTEKSGAAPAGTAGIETFVEKAVKKQKAGKEKKQKKRPQ